MIVDGIDCTDDLRNRQLWYRSRNGQLISTYIKGKGTEHHPEIVFYDPDDPFCLATAQAPRPSQPKLPPVVNFSLPLQVWAAELTNQSIAVVLMNTGAHSATITANWTQLGISTSLSMTVRDMFAHKDLGVATASVHAVVGSHDVAALLLSPVGTAITAQQ